MAYAQPLVATALALATRLAWEQLQAQALRIIQPWNIPQAMIDRFGLLTDSLRRSPGFHGKNHGFARARSAWHSAQRSKRPDQSRPSGHRLGLAPTPRGDPARYPGNRPSNRPRIRRRLTPTLAGSEATGTPAKDFLGLPAMLFAGTTRRRLFCTLGKGPPPAKDFLDFPPQTFPGAVSAIDTLYFYGEGETPRRFHGSPLDDLAGRPVRDQPVKPTP